MSKRVASEWQGSQSETLHNGSEQRKHHAFATYLQLNDLREV